MSKRLVICIICLTAIFYSMLCENLSLSKVGFFPPLIRPGIEPRQTQGSSDPQGGRAWMRRSVLSPLCTGKAPCTLNPPPVVSLSLGESAPAWRTREAALPSRDDSSSPPGLPRGVCGHQPPLTTILSLRCFLLLLFLLSSFPLLCFFSFFLSSFFFFPSPCLPEPSTVLLSSLAWGLKLMQTLSGERV